MRPSVSVLMPAYNSARFVRESVNSVLAQTLRDFELIVIDDCSQDGTTEILASICDPRLRVIRNKENLGVAESANIGFSQARGDYIARVDSDDFCLPTRFAKQKHFLDNHPNIVVVGSEMFNLEAGRLIHEPRPGEPDPIIVRWMFHVGNPVGHPSVMFRTELVRSLGSYLRKELRVCEDLDFSHRALRVGDIATMPEQLGIYRRHSQSLTHTRDLEVFERTVSILRTFYSEILGEEAARAAPLVAAHFMGRSPVRDKKTLEYLGGLLDRLLHRFLDAHELTAQQKQRVVAHAASVWWRTIRNSLAAGSVIPVTLSSNAFSAHSGARPPWRSLAGDVVQSAVSGNPLARRLRRVVAPLRATIERQPGPDSVKLDGLELCRAIVRRDNPPVLYVAVSLDQADDGRTLKNIQAIADRYGARPVYLVDSRIEGQPERRRALRHIAERGDCAIGMAFQDDAGKPSDQIARSDQSQEERLNHLKDVTDRCFRLAPLFLEMRLDEMRAHTMEMLQQAGFAVAFGAVRAGGGRRAERGIASVPSLMSPYRVEPGGILFVPTLDDLLAQKGKANVPDGGRGPARSGDFTREFRTVPSVRLVRSMIQRGFRTFAFRCDPATGIGSGSPVAELDDLFKFFFEDLGGLPGNPADLVPPGRRQQLLPEDSRRTGCIPAHFGKTQLSFPES